MTPDNRPTLYAQQPGLAAAVGPQHLSPGTASCIGGEVRESGFQPSDNPVTVDNVTKNDKLAELPRASTRASCDLRRRIFDAKLERMVAKVVGNLTLVSATLRRPTASLSPTAERVYAAGRLPLRERVAGAGQ